MSSPPFDAEAIRALADLLVETGLTEIEIAGKDTRVRIARQPAVPLPVAPPPAPPAGAPAAAQPSGAGPSPAGPSAAGPATEAALHPGVVKSPMVGIVYLGPEPGAAPFVTPGQQVAAGQTLLLVEAMKTFNQIKAPRAGRVTRVLVQSGAPVEYDEPLMILE